MMQWESVVWYVMIAGAVVSASAATTRCAIASDLIAAKMNEMGIQVSPDQIVLLTDVTATVPSPVLKVSSVEKLDHERMLVRLECEQSEQCLPFFVSIAPGHENDAQTTPPAGLSPVHLPARYAARPPVLRSGTPAKLLLQGEHVQITLSVICLESGAPGQTIRVTDKEHRMFYSAEVVNGALLKGTLQ